MFTFGAFILTMKIFGFAWLSCFLYLLTLRFLRAIPKTWNEFGMVVAAWGILSIVPALLFIIILWIVVLIKLWLGI